MHIFIHGAGLNDRRIKTNILSTSEKSVSNICPFASWHRYSQNYLNFKDKYNIDEMYESLINKSNVYFVSSTKKLILKTYVTNELEVVVNYIKEHYLVNDIKIQEIENFDGKICVYKLSEVE